MKVCLVVLLLLDSSLSLQLHFGDCPVFFYEKCIHPELVKFSISIPHNGTKIYDLDPMEPQLPSEFNPLIPIKMVIHGYGGLDIDTSSSNVTRAYQDVAYNVISVDWKPLAEIPCYTTAYLNTWYVAQCISILMIGLLPLGVSPRIVHVVGFSLGAHVAGLTGNSLQKIVGMSFLRITGLDPALPFFATLNNDWKLDKEDADFVDIIHTSAGTFGKLEATGHVDFYVNGGSMQPACQNRRYPPLCSHIMAGLYFAESIRGTALGGQSFIARQCDNVFHYVVGLCNGAENMALMGEIAHHFTRGTYYLETSSKPPYALGFNSFYLRKDSNWDVLKRFREFFKIP